jgi:hypothetical protein
MTPAEIAKILKPNQIIALRDPSECEEYQLKSLITFCREHPAAQLLDYMLEGRTPLGEEVLKHL